MSHVRALNLNDSRRTARVATSSLQLEDARMVALLSWGALLLCCSAKPHTLRRATARRGGATDAQDAMVARLRTGEGFVAALDQSGGRAPAP